MNMALHTLTPTLIVIDPRGLAIRNVAFYRSEPDEPVDERVNSQTCDAAGRLVSQRDPRLSIENLRTTYSLSNQALLTESVDAGWRLGLLNEAGLPVEGWDSRGSRRQVEYDAVLRPLAIIEDGLVTERLGYGGTDGFEHNQCNQLIRHDDTAGTLLWSDYSVIGSAITETRDFLKALETPDWPLTETDRDALLENDPLQTRHTFNALGEAIEQTDAMGNMQRFRQTVAGQLKSVALILAGTTQAQTLVGDIRYNAFDQVEQETAGNGVVSLAVYEASNGLLQSLSASRTGNETLQSLHYSYDPVGNILQIEDTVQPVRFFANQRIEPVSRYTYDTLYQLIEATGREVNSGASHGPALPGLQPLPPDPNQVSNYTQSYDYDPAGNLLQMRHVGAQSFTRTMRVAPDSNRSLPEGEVDADFNEAFDANGNMQQLIRGQTLGWDLRNQLQEITTVTRTTKASDHERYIYDGQGQRCRKINSAQTSSRTLNNEVRYLPGLEIRTTADGEILHVITAQNARVLHWQAGLPSGIENDQIRYSLSDHLGSSVLELDQQGNLISQESYYPFGGTSWWAARSAVDAKYKTIRYSGKERDASGLYYYGFRYYAPWLQRWINPDPAGDVDGLNTFEALHNNPLNSIDPQGNKPVPTKAHYFWEGSDIAELSLQNILMFQEVNPEYEINLWTSRPAQILNTLTALKESADPSKRVIANLHGESLNLRDPHELFKELAQFYPQAEKLESIFARENTGPFKNLAAGSDILELAAVYTEGGLYMDVDVAIGGSIGTLTAEHGFLIYIEDDFVSNAVIAATPQSDFVKRLMDEMVDRYTANPAMMFDNENAGWSKKRSTEGSGLISRLKLTMHMTGPSMINKFLPAYPQSVESYALPHGAFHHRTESDAAFSRDTPRTLLHIFTQGYTRGLNGEGGWDRVRPGRRASLA
ncbi:RHS repeat-associated core domain-containing protein [Pseudomonas lijiangensis]|uniref:Toxin n=2 Tax=Pseudomonas lijiangensis TaxID=2995658 RepID=A0ABX8HPT1_9PSED|nr:MULTISPECIES: RHS repeat-associated core domain-containing protein [Pseudomonas syringae group]MBX8489363.1 toxin [Pseudomonas cichorii]MBX8502806.1 toxin [Pseudomonas lijiangensis]MBX8542593.1 toxin [Pseudomonas cichorii]MBX8547638.1 toxin [Pseudomonas cichorii]MBX8552648.1 toxin [Pseudomonas cichorii]